MFFFVFWGGEFQIVGKTKSAFEETLSRMLDFFVVHLLSYGLMFRTGAFELFVRTMFSCFFLKKRVYLFCCIFFPPLPFLFFPFPYIVTLNQTIHPNDCELSKKKLARIMRFFPLVGPIECESVCVWTIRVFSKNSYSLSSIDRKKRKKKGGRLR